MTDQSQSVAKHQSERGLPAGCICRRVGAAIEWKQGCPVHPLPGAYPVTQPTMHSRSVCRKPVAVCERCGRLIWTVSQVFGSGDKFCDRPTCRGWLHWLG